MNLAHPTHTPIASRKTPAKSFRSIPPLWMMYSRDEVTREALMNMQVVKPGLVLTCNTARQQEGFLLAGVPLDFHGRQVYRVILLEDLNGPGVLLDSSEFTPTIAD